MSMLRSLFLKDYQYRDNYGDIDSTQTVTLHLAKSSWESNVLHIGLENAHENVVMNFNLEEVKELSAIINNFIDLAESNCEKR